MTRSRPKVSVVMPVYNAGRFLRPAVESILNQTLHDLELIAVNDGSTDDSGDVLAEMARLDGRLRVVAQVNAGVSNARNAGIAIASADVIAMMDSDDVSHPERLRLQLEMLNSNNELAAVGCGIRIVDDRREVRRIDPVESWSESGKDRFERRFDLAGPTLAIRTIALRRLGGYRSALSYADDYDLVARCIGEGLLLDNHPEYLYDYTIHSGQMTNVTGADQRLAVVAADLSREIRRRELDDPFDHAATLATVEVPDDLPRDLRLRLQALTQVAAHLAQGRDAAQEEMLDLASPAALAQLRDAMGRRAWRSDVMTGIHRDRYHEARAARQLLAALRAGIDLWAARRKPRTSPDDLFLPRPRRPAPGVAQH